MEIQTTKRYISTGYETEDLFCAATYMWLSQNYPGIRGYFFHIANENAGNNLVRMKAAAMGVLPGVPDFRFEPCPVCDTGFYIELKLLNGIKSKAQKELHKLWYKTPVFTCYGPAEVVAIIQTFYGLPKYP